MWVRRREESVASVQTREGFLRGGSVFIIHHVTSLTTVSSLTVPERTEEAREEGKDAKRAVQRERGDSTEEGTEKSKGREGKEGWIRKRK